MITEAEWIESLCDFQAACHEVRKKRPHLSVEQVIARAWALLPEAHVRYQNYLQQNGQVPPLLADVEDDDDEETPGDLPLIAPTGDDENEDEPEGPSEPCPQCDGSGIDAATGEQCTRCGGSGRVSYADEPVEESESAAAFINDPQMVAATSNFLAARNEVLKASFPTEWHRDPLAELVIEIEE